MTLVALRAGFTAVFFAHSVLAEPPAVAPPDVAAGGQEAVPAGPSRAAAQQDEPTPLRFQIDMGLSFGGGLYGTYLLGRVDAGYWILPFLLVGASVESSLAVTEQGDHCADGSQCPPVYSAFGPRAELSPFPDWVVGPWLGAGLGLALLSPSNQWDPPVRPRALEGNVDVGLEVRLAPGFLPGVYFAHDVLFSDVPVSNGLSYGLRTLDCLGLRGAGRF